MRTAVRLWFCRSSQINEPLMSLGESNFVLITAIYNCMSHRDCLTHCVGVFNFISLCKWDRWSCDSVAVHSVVVGGWRPRPGATENLMSRQRYSRCKNIKVFFFFEWAPTALSGTSASVLDGLGSSGLTLTKIQLVQSRANPRSFNN